MHNLPGSAIVSLWASILSIGGMTISRPDERVCSSSGNVELHEHWQLVAATPVIMETSPARYRGETTQVVQERWGLLDPQPGSGASQATNLKSANRI